MIGSNLTALAANSASSVVELFIPLRFVIFFYSKIFGIESSLCWEEGRVRGIVISLFHRFHLLSSSTAVLLVSGARWSTFRC